MFVLCLSTVKSHQTLNSLKKSKVDEAIRYLQDDFFNKMRDRSESDIPQQQGVCLTEGLLLIRDPSHFGAERASKSKTIKTFMPS